MNRFPCILLVAGCALLAGCDLRPSVVLVAKGESLDVVELTEAQGDCDSPGRISYVSWWDGATLSGCWVPETDIVRVCIPGQPDRRISLGEFRRIDGGERQHLALH